MVFWRPKPMRMRHLLTALPALVLLSCGGPGPEQPAPADHGTGSGSNAATAPAASERDRWQKPEVILGLMGNIAHMTVADLFADDGYFTFKLIEAGANVIAVVNDAGQAERIEAEKKRRGLGDDRLQVRVVPVGDPGIRNAEADMALIVHRFVGIHDKRDFFKRMRDGMKYPRYLVMVEWQNRQTAMGPPLSERLPSDRIMDLVGEVSEYSDVGAHSDKVPDQVVFLINDYIDPGAGGEVIEMPQ